jgi:hypothetical protein
MRRHVDTEPGGGQNLSETKDFMPPTLPMQKQSTERLTGSSPSGNSRTPA